MDGPGAGVGPLPPPPLPPVPDFPLDPLLEQDDNDVDVGGDNNDLGGDDLGGGDLGGGDLGGDADEDPVLPNMNGDGDGDGDGDGRGPDGNRCQASHAVILVARDEARSETRNGNQGRANPARATVMATSISGSDSSSISGSDSSIKLFAQNLATTWTEWSAETDSLASFFASPPSTQQADGDPAWRLTPDSIPTCLFHRDINLDVVADLRRRPAAIVLITVSTTSVGPVNSASSTTRPAIAALAWDPLKFSASQNRTLRGLSRRRAVSSWHYPLGGGGGHPADLARFAMRNPAAAITDVQRHLERPRPLPPSELREIGTNAQKKMLERLAAGGGSLTPSTEPVSVTFDDDTGGTNGTKHVTMILANDLSKLIDVSTASANMLNLASNKSNASSHNPKQIDVIDVSNASYDLVSAMWKSSKPLSASLGWFGGLLGVKYVGLQVITPKGTHFEVQHIDVSSAQAFAALRKIPSAAAFMLRIDVKGKIKIVEKKLPTFKMVKAPQRREVWWKSGWIRLARDVVRLGDLREVGDAASNPFVNGLVRCVRRSIPGFIPDQYLQALIEWAAGEAKPTESKETAIGKTGSAGSKRRNDDTRRDDNRKRVAEDLKYYIGREQERVDTKRQIEQSIRKLPRYMRKSDDEGF